MEKIITKRLEKFVSNAQNLIFADRFRDKVNAFNEKFVDHTETAIKSIVLKYRKTSKYVAGKERTKRFLISNIGDFEREHISIVNMIEDHRVEDNWEKYLKCKNRISAILRANRRMTSLKATDNERVKSYLNEYITRRRFAKNYQLST